MKTVSHGLRGNEYAKSETPDEPVTTVVRVHSAQSKSTHMLYGCGTFSVLPRAASYRRKDRTIILL